jgi:hypothetical protein
VSPPKGGEAVGPNLTDRGKPSTKRHGVVERGGLPLAVLVTAANRHDTIVCEALLDAIPAIRQPNGCRRKRPDKLRADQADDIPRCRRALSRCHSKVRMARKGIDASHRLGRHCWVVERTVS